MKIKRQSGNIAIVIVILIGVILISGAGVALYYYQKPGKPQPPTINKPVAKPPVKPTAIPAELAASKQLIQSDDILLEKADVAAQIPSYELPLITTDVSNWQDFSNKINLSQQTLAILEKNGFVVVTTPQDLDKNADDFAAFYSSLKSKDLPIFITSDSLLHYYHIFFDTTLMKLERDLFYDDIWQISEELLDYFIDEYSQLQSLSRNLTPQEEELSEALKRNIAYITVALELLKPDKNQILSDALLREEYCYQGMEQDYCQMMIDGVKQTYGEKASFTYFSEAEAQNYSYNYHGIGQDLVKQELELIAAHEGWEYSPIFIYKEDYSQYVPRGHYTKSEKLKNYFKALMWYGRMTALIKGSVDLNKGESICTGIFNGIISEYDAKIQTIQAALVAKQFLASSEVQKNWQRIYAITSFFVGYSDDLGPYEYGAVLKNLFKEQISLTDIAAKYQEIAATLAALEYNPKIYSGLGECQLFMPCPPLSDQEVQKLKVQAKDLLESTKGFRLMGQRYTVDSWLFSEIVSPYSGQYTGTDLALPTDKKPFTFIWNDSYATYRDNRPFSWVKTLVAGCPEGREVRGFPRGLDVMALFGSQRAKEVLNELGDDQYSDYQKKFTKLKTEIDSLKTEDWFQNVYWNWLYVLKSLFEEYGSGYQTFMQTQAWQDKQLNAALASWAELRHDTILYVKQSYTMAELGGGPGAPPVVGYVEPVPEFYIRLKNLTNMTLKGLEALLSEEELRQLGVNYALSDFSDVLSRLLEISKKELANQELTEDEYRFIENFGGTSERLIESISGGDVDPDIFKTVMIADVHTEGNVEKVLEEGVGYIKTLFVVYKLPQGHLLVGVGPVFSYYEFKQPMNNRLTDEEWRKILDSKTHPPQPKWTKSFSEIE